MSKIVEHQPRLLVVDDDDDFRTLVRQLLVDEGFEVDTASSGEDALHAARARSYDLVLLDLQMPGMDGKQVLKILKPESPNTDFMMVTGYQDIDTAVELLKFGAKEFVTKPIVTHDFTQRVKLTLRSHGAEARLKQLQAEFSSRLLYDLHAPITAISSATDFLKNNMGGPTTEQQQQVLANIKSNLVKVDTLLNDMIDLTHFESGTVEIDKLPTNLDELIPSICSRMKHLADAKNISISVQVEGNVSTVEVDPEKMDQAIHNLIDNGIKYTNDGGTIRVRLATVQRPLHGMKRECVEIAVTDSGVGISKAELSFVFDKYKDVLTGRTSTQKTTGLGLAICRSIIEAHNGSVGVESELGTGSTFRILLPTDAA